MKIITDQIISQIIFHLSITTYICCSSVFWALAKVLWNFRMCVKEPWGKVISGTTMAWELCVYCVRTQQNPVVFWIFSSKNTLENCFPLRLWPSYIHLHLKEQKVWKGVAASHRKSSTQLKLTNLVLATPQWVDDSGVPLSGAIMPHHSAVIIACPSRCSTCEALCQTAGHHQKEYYSTVLICRSIRRTNIAT